MMVEWYTKPQYRFLTFAALYILLWDCLKLQSSIYDSFQQNVTHFGLSTNLAAFNSALILDLLPYCTPKCFEIFLELLPDLLPEISSLFKSFHNYLHFAIA